MCTTQIQSDFKILGKARPGWRLIQLWVNVTVLGGKRDSLYYTRSLLSLSRTCSIQSLSAQQQLLGPGWDQSLNYPGMKPSPTFSISGEHLQTALMGLYIDIDDIDID